jgi:hypothetical protein
MKFLETLKEVAGNRMVVRASFYAAGFGMGFLTARHLVQKQERLRYEVLLDEELEKTKAFYKVLHKKEEYSTPPVVEEENVATGPPAQQYSLFHDRVETEEKEEEAPEPVLEVEDERSRPKTEEERKARLKEKYDKGEAFMVWDMELDWSVRIDQEEFLKNVHGYDQVSWTYFSEDAVMSDEHNQFISDWKTMIDPDHVETLDSDAVEETVMFIRNKDRNTEYMVTLDTGSYSSTLGIDDHIQHEYGPKVKKFRSEDE